MRCPSCGSHQRDHYERCQSCNSLMDSDRDESEEDERSRYSRSRPVQSNVRLRRGGPGGASRYESEDDQSPDAYAEPYRPARRSSRLKPKSRVSPAIGLFVTVLVAIGAVGLTVFLIMKSPEDQSLQKRGEHELANAQYAFAVQTLTKASALRPKDPKVFLELARAYVGIDQVDKAWDCIKHAQTLGSGVIEEPSLASDLANYYRRRGKYQKAIELLRPLGKAGIPGKKAELADLDAAWGDDLLSEGKTDEALRCWEEVRDLREGSRYPEAEARLSTIYQRLANNLSGKKDDEAALAYLTKLNNIAQNSRNYEMASDIYEREGKLDLAIEQLRKASNMAGKNGSINQKLGALLSRRGKELLDEGNSDAGLGYLQQAKDLSPENNSLPKAILRSVAISYEAGHQPRLTGEVWNASDKTISSMVLKVELWDNSESKSLWQKEQRLVDAFTPPLTGHESRTFDLSAPVSVKSDGQTEFRTYLDGELYKAYVLGKKDAHAEDTADAGKSAKRAKKSAAAAEAAADRYTTQTSPATQATVAPPAQSSSRGSAEEKTMRDLEN